MGKSAILNLAKAALQNGCSDPRIFRHIANTARVLTKVPQELWGEADWSATDDDLSFASGSSQ